MNNFSILKIILRVLIVIIEKVLGFIFLLCMSPVKVFVCYLSTKSRKEKIINYIFHLNKSKITKYVL